MATRKMPLQFTHLDAITSEQQRNFQYMWEEIRQVIGPTVEAGTWTVQAGLLSAIPNTFGTTDAYQQAYWATDYNWLYIWNGTGWGCPGWAGDQLVWKRSALPQPITGYQLCNGATSISCSQQDGTIIVIDIPNLTSGNPYVRGGTVYSGPTVQAAVAPTITNTLAITGSPSLSGSPSLTGSPALTGTPSLTGVPSVTIGNPTLTGSITGTNAAVTVVSGTISGTNAAVTIVSGGVQGSNGSITIASGGVQGTNAAVTITSGGPTGTNAAVTITSGGVQGTNAAVTISSGGVQGTNTTISISKSGVGISGHGGLTGAPTIIMNVTGTVSGNIPAHTHGVHGGYSSEPVTTGACYGYTRVLEDPAGAYVIPDINDITMSGNTDGTSTVANGLTFTSGQASSAFGGFSWGFSTMDGTLGTLDLIASTLTGAAATWTNTSQNYVFSAPTWSNTGNTMVFSAPVWTSTGNNYVFSAPAWTNTSENYVFNSPTWSNTGHTYIFSAPTWSNTSNQVWSAPTWTYGGTLGATNPTPSVGIGTLACTIGTLTATIGTLIATIGTLTTTAGSLALSGSVTAGTQAEPLHMTLIPYWRLQHEYTRNSITSTVETH